MITFRTLHPEELPTWYAHVTEVFQGTPLPYFKSHMENDPTAGPENIFIAAEGLEILSTVRLIPRKVWLMGREISVGGIGEVCTKPAHRGKGLGTHLLHMALQAMADRELPLSILFGNQPMYHRAGYCSVPVAWRKTETHALPDLPPGAAIRPYQPGDLPTLMGLYDLYAGRLSGGVIREEAYWHRWVLPHFTSPEWDLPQILHFEDRPVAYAMGRTASDAGGLLGVGEICAAPQGEALLPAFLKGLAARAQAERIAFPAPLLPQAEGENTLAPEGMMMRLNRPMPGIPDTQALIASCGPFGFFPIDSF